ncbi:MAG: hypothetical protein WEB06_10835 [Actinomycetota bacterium]
MNVKRWIAILAAAAAALAILRWWDRRRKAEEDLGFEAEGRRAAEAA